MHIPYLPNEVMCMVASHVDVADILNLRLSAKVFREGTAARFAKIYFQDRVYELSSVGLGALVKITEHPVFARHIKSVVIGFKDRRGTPNYYSLLDQAFSNLAIHGNIISIGIRGLHTSPTSRCILRASLEKVWQFFDKKMLVAASEAELRIDRVIADLQGPYPTRALAWVPDFVHYACRYKARIGHSGLQIHVPSSKRGDHLSGRLTITAPDYSRLEATQACLQSSFPFDSLLRTIIKKVYLHGCDMEDDSLVDLLHRNLRWLEHITLCDIRLLAEGSTPGPTWPRVFTAMKYDCTSLETCEFGELQDTSGNTWLEGGNKTIKASTPTQTRTVISNLAASIRDFTLEE
ncbi:hypothetical protein E4T43_00364 [Aureobasidium subglaciale]|nr:hypothetical protein E4T43_00364 [Aureobasidium subglaciale]